MPARFLPQHKTLRAGLYMVLAMACFVTNDSFVKVVGASLPVGEIVWIRGALSALMIFAVCAQQGVLDDLSQMASAQVMARGGLDLIGSLLFVTALMHMEIANLTAILQAVPLVVAVFSVMFLGERVGWRRASAIALGFLGVMLIVRPSPASFTLYDAMALGIVLAVALRDLVTRVIPAKVPTLIIALANAVFVTLGGLALAATENFVVPQAWQIACLAAAALFLGLGYLFMVSTLRLGNMSATAPFRYSIVVFAIISGIMVFGEFPDLLAIVGMGLIVATGLYAAHREAIVKDTSRLR